jgi:pimeloyl-ACP methyl ester carboxylesterase
MAAMSPEIARSVVTWGSGGAVNETHLPMLEMFDSVIDNPVEFMVGFSNYLKAAYGEENARAMTKSFANANRALIERGEGISLTRVGNIRCPVLLIAGEHDFFVTRRMLTELAALIPGARLEIVEGAGHGVHDDNPEWFNQTLLDWLSSH